MDENNNIAEQELNFWHTYYIRVPSGSYINIIISHDLSFDSSENRKCWEDYASIYVPVERKKMPGAPDNFYEVGLAYGMKRSDLEMIFAYSLTEYGVHCTDRTVNIKDSEYTTFTSVLILDPDLSTAMKIIDNFEAQVMKDFKSYIVKQAEKGYVR